MFPRSSPRSPPVPLRPDQHASSPTWSRRFREGDRTPTAESQRCLLGLNEVREGTGFSEFSDTPLRSFVLTDPRKGPLTQLLFELAQLVLWAVFSAVNVAHTHDG